MLMMPYFSFIPDQGILLGSLSGAMVGGVIAGIMTLAVSWRLAKRLHKMRVLDHARRELKAPLTAYIEWLHAVSSEFSQWRVDLIPHYRANHAKDQEQLNRMRALFVDVRNVSWFERLEEYDTLLGLFQKAIKAMWFRQTEIGMTFASVLENIESNPEETLLKAEKLETIAFEQSQLVSDFIYHLQYECLKSIATQKPRRPRDIRKPRIIRTAFGGIKVVQPEAIAAVKHLSL